MARWSIVCCRFEEKRACSAPFGGESADLPAEAMCGSRGAKSTGADAVPAGGSSSQLAAQGLGQRNSPMRRAGRTQRWTTDRMYDLGALGAVDQQGLSTFQVGRAGGAVQLGIGLVGIDDAAYRVG